MAVVVVAAVVVLVAVVVVAAVEALALNQEQDLLDPDPMDADRGILSLALAAVFEAWP